MKLLPASNLPAQEALVLYKGRIRLLAERLPFLPAAARADVVAELKHELQEARRLRAAAARASSRADAHLMASAAEQI